MKETIQNRLTSLRENLGINKSELARKLNLTPQAISSIELGKAALTDRNIDHICLTFGIREEWLRYGTGEMFVDKDSTLKRELMQIFEGLSPSSRKMILSFARTMFENDQAMQSRDASDDVPDEQSGEKAPHPIHEQARA
jgi:transcriptional regulator with XRE-family HTH domain